MAKICLDTNIALDIVLSREPHIADIIPIIEMAIDGTISLQFTESSLVNTLFITRKYETTGDRGLSKITKLLRSLEIISAPKGIYIQALESSFPDKEDAIQYYVALHNSCDYFITRNVKHYRPFISSALSAVTPAEFLREIEPPADL